MGRQLRTGALRNLCRRPKASTAWSDRNISHRSVPRPHSLQPYTGQAYPSVYNALQCQSGQVLPPGAYFFQSAISLMNHAFFLSNPQSNTRGSTSLSFSEEWELLPLPTDWCRHSGNFRARLLHAVAHQDCNGVHFAVCLNPHSAGGKCQKTRLILSHEQ